MSEHGKDNHENESEQEACSSNQPEEQALFEETKKPLEHFFKHDLATHTTR